MVGDQAGGTHLLIDVGHVLTHVAYIARVEGVARLVALAEASTTLAGDDEGLIQSVRRAIASLELLVGRQIVDSTGELRWPSDSDGHGVDAVATTTSLAPPLQVALVGLTAGFSLASAVRAINVPHVALVRVVSLESSRQRWETADLEALVRNPPDVIVLVGGVDGGPVTPIREMGEALGAAYSILPAEKRPVVIFAGNECARKPLIAALSGVADLRFVANVRPSTDVEKLVELRNEVIRLFYSRELGQSEQLRSLGQWAGNNVMDDVDCMARTLRFVAQRQKLTRGVLGVDLGGSGTRLVLLHPEGAALTWAAPYGSGAGLAALRQLNDPTAVVRWLRHSLSWAEVWDRLSNVEVRPGTVPQSDEDWDLQQAAACEALNRSWAEAQAAWGSYVADSVVANGPDLIIARGTVLNRARTPGQATLALINGLQPTGLLRLALDWANVLPGLVSVAQLDPMAAVQVLDNDALMDLGTLVAPDGSVKGGSVAVKVRLTVRGETRADVNVAAGSICRLPLEPDERGKLEISLARGLHIGQAGKSRTLTAEVRGGALGVIIDARGRPITLPANDLERNRTLETWQREIDEG